MNANRHAKGTKRKMAQILSDPIMRDLQDKALAFHAKRVEMLRTSGEYDTWLKELKEASDIPLEKLDEVLFVQHLPKEWQQKVKELQAAGIPDKKIAKMISQTQTAKKGETRQALLAAAGENAEEKLDAHQLKGKESKGDSLDNPFMDTEAAAGLGVPLMNERTQKIALAAQAADPKDAGAQKLIAKAAAAKKVKDAQKDSQKQMDSQKATVDLTEPAPPLDQIVEDATVEASTTIESPEGTVPIPEAAPSETASVKKAPAKKPAAKKPAAPKRAASRAPAKKPATRKTAAKKPAAKSTTARRAATKKPAAPKSATKAKTASKTATQKATPK
jgi:hypothetical protein